MYVSMQMYCFALKKHRDTINLSRYAAIDKALRRALMHSEALEMHVSKQLNKESRNAGMTYAIKPWKAKKTFGFKAFDDADLSMSLGHITIDIEVAVIDATENDYTCDVKLSMRDIYDFAEFGRERKWPVRTINNCLGYQFQEKGVIHPYSWKYNCSFMKKYDRK